VDSAVMLFQTSEGTLAPCCCVFLSQLTLILLCPRLAQVPV
jgi:hypothetical protein